MVDEEDVNEKFDESTYNNRIEKFNSAFGDQAMNADSVVMVIRKTQGMIRETNEFLSKLYNANNNNLWYKTNPREEVFTTMEPDYRMVLRKQYGERLRNIRALDRKIASVEARLAKISSELSTKTELDERTPLLKKRVETIRKINKLKTQREEEVDASVQIDVDLLQAAFDEHDSVVSIKKNNMTPRIFQQVWNEKIMNTYEKEKIQYMTSEEKTRYFKEKLRDISKMDKHGVLTHQDWFFRVAVMDFVSNEMQRLIYWFKNCSYDAFDTIYKIVRKLKMLHLDMEAAFSEDDFIVNNTNLFYMSDDDMKEFSKLDGMLTGNTLYELFKSQVKLKVVSEESSSSSDKQEEKDVDKEILVDRNSEEDIEKQRKLRQDIVTRVWGNESELTRAAYARVNDKDTEWPLDPSYYELGVTNIQELKKKIIELKLKNDGQDDSTLSKLLYAFTNEIGVVKEHMVIE